MKNKSNAQKYKIKVPFAVLSKKVLIGMILTSTITPIVSPNFAIVAEAATTPILYEFSLATSGFQVATNEIRLLVKSSGQGGEVLLLKGYITKPDGTKMATQTIASKTASSTGYTNFLYEGVDVSAYPHGDGYTITGWIQNQSDGKVSAIKTATFSIDRVAPTAPTLTPSTTSATNQDVSVTITYPTDSVKDEYSLDNGVTWMTYSTPIVMSSNGTIKARATDQAGNVSSIATRTISNIDKTAPTAPTIAVSTTALTNQNVTVTLTFPSDSSLDQYRINGGTWTTYSAPFAMTANGTVEARSRDSAGNYSTIATKSITNIDKTPPANATFTPSTTAPTNQNVSLTINYPADATTKQYKIGSTGTWTTYSTPISVSADNTVVYARSYDSVGNLSAETSYTVTNIDKVAPTTPTLSADVTTPTNGNVIVTASFPADATVKEYSLNDGAWTAYTVPITFTGNGKLEVRAKDVAGNYSAIGVYNVSNIDKTAPANASFNPSTTAPTNQNVTVTINYPADSVTKQYKVGATGTWTTYSAPVSLSSNNTVYARSYDEVGNLSSESSYAVTNIDKVAPTTPTVSADVTAPTNGNVVLTATFPSDASLKEYRLNGGTWTAYTVPVTMTANGTFEARAKDEAGNYSAIGTYTVTNIDKTAPVNATFTPSTTAPTNQNVSVTINYPADASVKQYKIGSTGTWATYSVPISVSDDNTVIYARSFDAVGNVSAESNYTVTNIDKVAPNTPTVSADVTTPTNGDVVLTATYPTDATLKEYRINGGTWTAYTGSVTMTTNGTFEARARDNAGNYSAIESYSVTNIDKTAPANATFTPSTTALTNQNVTLTISYPSDASVKQYKIGSAGTWTSYSTPVVLSSNNTVYARSYDAVGNVSAETNYAVSNIDKVAPTTPTVSADVTQPTNGDVILTASFSADSTVKEYRLNGGAWTAYTAPVTVKANGTFEVRGKDTAGNYSPINTYEVTNIDKTAPANATLIPNSTSPTNQNVTVTIDYPADASIKEYKVGTTGTWTAYTAPVVLSSNNTVYARSTDAVGNVSAETSVVVSNIDKVAPVTPTISADVTSGTNGNVILTATFPLDASVKEYRLNGGTWTAYTTAVTMTNNGTFEVRAKDVAGNYSAIGSYTVSNIDKTPPANATLTASTTNPTNQDVSVTIAYPADASVKQYKVGLTGTWTTYLAPVVLTSNNTIYARSFDAVGNVSAETTLIVSNIDKIAPATPSLMADVTAPTNGNVIITATFPSDASVKEYRVNSGAWTTYASSITMTSNGTVEVRTKDVAGNYSSIANYNVSNIDKTAPSNATFSSSTTSPTNQDVTLTISYPSDADAKEYKIGSTGTWTSYSSPIVLTSNQTVYARSMDAVGNISAETSYAVTNIDKVAPSTPTVTADVISPTNGNVIVTASFPIDASVKEYRLNGGTWTAYTAPITMTSNGTFEVRAKDVAGNYSSIGSYSVANIDKTAPASATLTPSATTITNQDVSVSIAYPADASIKQYRIGSTGTWTDYVSPVVMSNNGTVYARSFDAVGNVSTETSYAVTNIDKVAPNKPAITPDRTSATNGNVTLTVAYSGDSTLKEYRINGGSWTAYTSPVVMDSNGTFEARGKDHAGNYSIIASYSVTNIDKVAPDNATLTVSTILPTNQNVSVTISYPSDASVKEYKIGSTGTWTPYTSPISVSSNTTVFARSMDAVGNVSLESSLEVNNIDKVAPTIPTLIADQTAGTNKDVTVTVNFPSDAVLKEYRINGGTWTSYTVPVLINANGTVEARAKDEAGNYSSIGSYTVSNIDKIAPLEPTLSANTTAPTNQDVTVTISYPSDATVKQYKVGINGTWTTYTSPITLSSNETIFARGFDAVGNVSKEVSMNVTNIDKVVPTTPTISADVTIPTNGNVILTASFPVDASTKEYRVNGGVWTPYTTAITLTANGKMEVRATDNAGNVSVIASYEVNNIDKTAPVPATLVADKTAPTNTDVTVTISYPADASVKQYKIGATGTWTVYTTPVLVSSNNTVFARSYDSVGNLSTESSYIVSNIDKVKPVASTFTADKTVPTNQNVSVTVIFASDALKKEVRVNGGAWFSYTSPIVFESNGYVEARSTDNAGNVSDVTRYNVSNIDKTIPQSPSYSVSENENKFTLTGDSQTKVFYRLNEGAWVEYASPVVTNDGVYKVDVKSVDLAKNESPINTFNSTMYRDSLAVAKASVENAETEKTQQSVDVAKEKVGRMPAETPEYQPLIERVVDVQALIDAQLAIQKATETRNEQDLQDAQKKIDLLNGSNPVIVDLLDGIQEDFREADILTYVAKERYDILSSRYQMSKESYTALVNIYYAIKYTGDFLYGYAKDKVALVPATDKHYTFVQEQFDELGVKYGQFTQQRQQTDAEIKAESSVKTMETKYDPSMAVNTQNLINAVEDATVRASLQQRLDMAKAKYEASQLAKVDQDAIIAVEKAESTKQTYYVSEAYKKVNALANETLKANLTNRLKALEAQMALDKQIADATRTVELAEQYKNQSYIDSAQNKINALPAGEAKTSLQQRLDVVKAGLPTSDQATIIKQATNYVSLAQSLKTQYYVDKAQGYINQIIDPVKKAELQTKLDAIVVTK